MNHKRYRGVATLAALLLVTYSSPTQLRAEVGVMTLKEAMTIAKEQNGELKALREEIGIGEANRLRSGLRLNPVLDLEAETGALTGSSSENRLSIGLSQEFFTGGKRGKQLAVAEAELLRYRAQIGNSERLLLLDVKRGYYDLLLAQGRLDLARKSQELNGKLLQVTKERFAAGDVAEIEVNLAQVEAARSEAGKLEAVRDLGPARQRLLALMGASAKDTLQAVDNRTVVPPRHDLPALKKRALENRADLQSVQSEVAKGEAEVMLAHAGRLPNLTAGVAFSVENSRTEVGGFDEKETDYLIGVKISAPLPLFDRNQAGLMEARARKSASESRRLYARQNIERDVEVAVAGLTASEAALQLYTGTILPQLTENLNLVQQAYRYGEIGVQAVIEEQRKFLEVNQGYLAALHQRNTALAQLEASVGIELSEIDGGKL